MTYYPMSATHVTGQDDAGQRHAVELYEAIDAGRVHRGPIAVCGRPVESLCGYRVPDRCVHTVADRLVEHGLLELVGWNGSCNQLAVAEWPPFSFRRCTECFARTGRPRVGKDSVWRNQERPT